MFPPGVPYSKRLFDLALTIPGLVLISPFLLIIAGLVWIYYGRPVLFSQARGGYRGKPFNVFKFRSMTNTRGPQGNLLSDSERLTRFGRFLRSTSLDELPELFNVLRGEMSLVGPRPPLVYEMDVYKEWHKKRLDVLPGVTGMWQVKGRNRVSFDEMVRMDIEYIEHQSMWLDFKILLQTPWAALHTRGAG